MAYEMRIMHQMVNYNPPENHKLCCIWMQRMQTILTGTVQKVSIIHCDKKYYPPYNHHASKMPYFQVITTC